MNFRINTAKQVGVAEGVTRAFERNSVVVCTNSVASRVATAIQCPSSVLSNGNGIAQIAGFTFDSDEFRQRFFPRATVEEWRNWRWQMRWQEKRESL